MERDLARRLELVLESDFVGGALVWNDQGKIHRTHYARRLNTTQPRISSLSKVLAPFDAIGPKVVDVATKLRSMLDRDFETGCLVRNHEGKVNRTEYAKRIGVERSYLAAFRHVLQPFDDMGPKVVSTHDRLRATLEADMATGSIVLSRMNSINERHYMAQVGITNRRPYARLFAEFEARLGLGDSLQVQLQQLLEADFVAGTLRIGRAGKISRLHYAETLGVGKTLLTPHIRLFTYYESPSGRLNWNLIASAFRNWLDMSQHDKSAAMKGGIGHEAVANFDRNLVPVDYSHPHLMLFLSGVELGDSQVGVADCFSADLPPLFLPPLPGIGVCNRPQGVVSLQDCRMFEGDVPPPKDHPPTNIICAGGENHLPHEIEVSLLEPAELTAPPAQSPSHSSDIPQTGASCTAHTPRQNPNSSGHYPELERHQNYPVDSTKARLVERLNSYIAETADLPRSRGGKVDRRRLSFELGFSKSAIWNYMDIVSDYERALGGLMSVHEAKVDSMRTWLEARMADGTLQVRDGRLERMQLWKQFHLGKSGNALDRYPAIRQLVEDFDNRIKETGYLPGRTADRVSALTHYLRTECSFNKDRLHYNQNEAAQAIGCAIGDLRRPPFSTVLQREEARHRQRLIADPLTVIVGGRVNSFHELVQLGLAKPYVVRICESFERLYLNARKDRVKEHYLALLKWFRFTATGAPSCCRAVLEALNASGPKSITGRDWAGLKLEYREWVRSQKNKGQAAYVNKQLSDTNAILKWLANEGLLPALDGGLIQVPERGQRHLSSLAEVGTKAEADQRSTERDTDAIDAYLDFATRMLRSGAAARDIDLEPTELSAFSTTLRQELSAKPIDPGSNPATVILEVLTRRLASVQMCATKVLKQEMDHWKEGQRLLATGCFLGADWSEIISGNIRNHERTALIQKYFPTSEEGRAQGIANLLKLVATEFGYVFPAMAKEKRQWGAFFQKRALAYGGIQHLQSYLVPSARAVTAVLTLYMAKSGGNCALARSLFPDSVEDTERPGEVEVTGLKARAGGKPIHTLFPRSSIVVQGLRWLGVIVETLSPFVSEQFRNQLSLVKGRNDTLKVLEEWTFRDHFKKLLSEEPELAQLDITPNMLRPTVLLIATLEADGGTTVSRAIGQHSAKVNVGYTDKAPTRLMRDYDIYHYTHLLETVVIHRVDEAHALLGVTPEQMERRIDDLMKTGVGTFCQDRFGRPGNDGTACQEMDCWNNCPQLLVVARPQEIAIIQIWQRSLREVEGEWVRDRPERWMEVWLPWLCFVDSVETKMRISHLPVWREATAIAERIMAGPTFKLMRLF